MATKVKLMKMLEEIRGYAQITNRRPAPRPPMLYLMQLRAQAAQAAAPRLRLTVATDVKENPLTPLPFKINHIKAEDSSLPIVFC